jgi:hypothetical protein
VKRYIVPVEFGTPSHPGLSKPVSADHDPAVHPWHIYRVAKGEKPVEVGSRITRDIHPPALPALSIAHSLTADDEIRFRVRAESCISFRQAVAGKEIFGIVENNRP